MASQALERAQIEAGDTVVVVRPPADGIVRDVLELVGEDGSVIVVADSAGRLEALVSACDDPRVSFLIGDAHVLPLPDSSADAVVAMGDTDPAEAERVTRRR